MNKIYYENKSNIKLFVILQQTQTGSKMLAIGVCR